jgi:hypothetical protein
MRFHRQEEVIRLVKSGLKSHVSMKLKPINGRHDTQYNDVQHNNKKMPLTAYAECSYAACHL